MEQLFSTAIFDGPMVEDLTLLANHGVQVHCFEFGYKGTMTMSDIFRLSPLKLFLNFFGRYTGLKLYQKPLLGVCHGDDLFYMFPFGVFGFPKALKTASDKSISRSQWARKLKKVLTKNS